MLTSILKLISFEPSCSTRKTAPFVCQSKPVKMGVLDSVRTKPITAWSIILGIVVLAALLRLFMLSSQSLWLDEGASLAMTDSGTVKGTLDALWSITGGDKYQVVYFLVLSTWRSWVGDSQFYLQSLSVVPGILTPVFIYLAVKILFGARHAVIAAVFVTCSAFCISFSQEVRPYAYLICIASLHLLAMTPALKDSEPLNIHRWLFALVTFLATLSSVFLVVFISALALAHLFTFRQLRSWFRWWYPSVLLSVPALIYYWSTPARTNLSVDAINNTGSPIWENMIYALYSHLAGQTYGPAVNALRETDNVRALLVEHAFSLGLLALLAFALVWYVFQALRKSVERNLNGTRVRFFISLFVFSFALATGFATLTSINWMPRHSFYLIVPISVLVSVAVAQSVQIGFEKRTSITDRLPMLIYPLLLTVNLYSSYQYFFQPEHLLDDYRSAANYLSENVKEEDSSLMLWGEPYLLSYYGDSRTKSVWRLENPNLIMGEIDEASLMSANVYIVINRESTWERYSNVLLGQLNQTYKLVPKAQFTNFTIYGLETNSTTLATNARDVQSIQDIQDVEDIQDIQDIQDVQDVQDI